MKNEAQLSPNNRSNGALPECSGNSEASAIVSKRRILNSAKHKCGDFRPSARAEGGRDENYRMRVTRWPANAGDAGHGNGRSCESNADARGQQRAGVLFEAPAASACRH